jgi:hypothetical protein
MGEKTRREKFGMFSRLKDFVEESTAETKDIGIYQYMKDYKVSSKESIGYHQLKKHKPWFDEGCSKLLDQRKRAKLQWLQDPSEINGDNLDNIKHQTSRHLHFSSY